MVVVLYAKDIVNQLQALFLLRFWSCHQSMTSAYINLEVTICHLKKTTVGISEKFLFNFSELLTILRHWYFRDYLTEGQSGNRELNVELVKVGLIPVGRSVKCCAVSSKNAHCSNFLYACSVYFFSRIYVVFSQRVHHSIF